MDGKRRDVDGQRQRGPQAAGIRLAASRQAQRCSVIDAGAQNRQPQGDIHAIAEARVLDHRQALIMVHRDDDVGALQESRGKCRIRGHRPLDVQALRLQFENHRLYDSISSRPKCPDSPACGLSPSTAILGLAREKFRSKSMLTMRRVARRRSRVMARGTSASAR